MAAARTHEIDNDRAMTARSEPDVSPIRAGMSAVYQSLERIEGKVARLGDRLEPVLSPEIDGILSESESHARRSVAPLAEELQSFCRLAEGIEGRLEGLLERLHV